MEASSAVLAELGSTAPAYEGDEIDSSPLLSTTAAQTTKAFRKTFTTFDASRQLFMNFVNESLPGSGRVTETFGADLEKIAPIDKKAAEFLVVEVLYKAPRKFVTRGSKISECVDLLTYVFPSVVLPPKLDFAWRATVLKHVSLQPEESIE